MTKYLHTFLPLDIKHNIKTVVSPFFGSGAFEYYLIEQFPHITLKGYDIEKELVNYHCCLIENPKLLYEEISKYFLEPLEKNEFIKYRNILTRKTINEENKFFLAAILFGLSRNCYSGKLRSYAKKPRIINIEKMKDYSFKNNIKQGNINIRVKDSFSVLKNKKIQNNDKCLIYLDPPYYLENKPRLNHYGITILQPPFDHIKLHKLLQKIKTKWILSYNNSEYILNLYNDFNIYVKDVVYLRYTKTKTFSDKYKELIITNFN